MESYGDREELPAEGGSMSYIPKPNDVMGAAVVAALIVLLISVWSGDPR